MTTAYTETGGLPFPGRKTPTASGRLLVRRRVLLAIKRHAQIESPLECCGFLTGRGDVIDDCVPVTNQSRSKSEFSIAPKDLFDFFRRLRATGRQWIGLYHSHPLSPAVPSIQDVEEFHYPQVSYWIVSLAERPVDIRCYKWVRIGFRETDYRILPE